MLLENRSKMKFQVQLDLKFDDESVKTLTVNVGDTIRIAFRRNGVKLIRQGKVIKIFPSRIIESQLYGSKKLSSIIELDCSTDYKAISYKVDIDDILDILDVVENGGEDNPGTGTECQCDEYWHDLDELFESSEVTS